MPTYIALLRGIDVSGQKLIKMTDLKELFQSLGFHEVQTCIQSGNVFFLYCPDGYGLTKLSNPFLEKKLKTSATTRNLNTVLKLCEMAK